MQDIERHAIVKVCLEDIKNMILIIINGNGKKVYEMIDFLLVLF